jgi:hypothetical protein
VTNAGAAWLGATLAAGWLLVLTVADLVVPSSIVPDPLFALAPLTAVALVVLSGLYNQTWDQA